MSTLVTEIGKRSASIKKTSGLMNLQQIDLKIKTRSKIGHLLEYRQKTKKKPAIPELSQGVSTNRVYNLEAPNKDDMNLKVDILDPMVDIPDMQPEMTFSTKINKWE